MGEATTAPNLAQQLRTALTDRLDRTVFFVAGDEVEYGSVVRWMAVAKREGATTVALQVKPPAVSETGSGANP
jgi:biopolymer transport protein ExbD